MGITYKDAVRAQEEIEDTILADPNVVSVGVVAETDEYGKATGDYAVQVGVLSIDAYLRAEKQGHTGIPSEYLLQAENEFPKEKHVHVNVVKEGKIEALSPYSEPGSIDPPTAIDDDLPASAKATVNYTLRRRPSPGGQSVGHPDVSAGTLGLLLEYTDGPNQGKAYLLSNNHVIADNNRASVGDPILQPGAHDSGNVEKDTIAYLHRWVPLLTSGFNYVDAAIAEIRGNLKWSHYVDPYISHIGTPEDVLDPTIGMHVEKVGRTTGHTQGQILSAKFSTKITYPMGILTFKNQIRTTSMSKPGDSGSALISLGERKPVGLLFAGSDTASYCNPMSVVLSTLSMPHSYQYPSGTTCRFKADNSLRILQKRTYTTHAISHLPGQKTALSSSLRVIPKKFAVIAAMASGLGLFANAKLISTPHSAAGEPTPQSRLGS